MRKLICALVVASLMIVAPAWGQATSEARGKVTDKDGNPLPDVELVFVSANGGGRWGNGCRFSLRRSNRYASKSVAHKSRSTNS